MKSSVAILFAITLFLSIHNADAAKCKYQENSTDKFTKVLTQWTKWNPLTNTFTMGFRDHSLFISAHAVDGDAQLLVKIKTFMQKGEAPLVYELEDYIVVPEGAPILIMMQDETITELRAKKEVRARAYTVPPEEADYDTNLHVTSATAIIKYTLDASIIEALISQPATKVRITTDGDNFDFDIHKKSFGDFQKDIQCVM